MHTMLHAASPEQHDSTASTVRSDHVRCRFALCGMTKAMVKLGACCATLADLGSTDDPLCGPDASAGRSTPICRAFIPQDSCYLMCLGGPSLPLSHGWAAAAGCWAVSLQTRRGRRPGSGAAHQARQVIHCVGTRNELRSAPQGRGHHLVCKLTLACVGEQRSIPCPHVGDGHAHSAAHMVQNETPLHRSWSLLSDSRRGKDGRTSGANAREGSTSSPRPPWPGISAASDAGPSCSLRSGVGSVSGFQIGVPASKARNRSHAMNRKHPPRPRASPGSER